ncbi:hypothetical protein Godav_023285, partial [Gossypium davidsonii]|nr:hypothetical protein [Gossypium davidsonii]
MDDGLNNSVLDLFLELRGHWDFKKNGELFLETSDNELLLFDPSTGELKNLGIHPNKGPVHILTYVESLVPISERLEEEEAIIRLPPGDTIN